MSIIFFTKSPVPGKSKTRLFDFVTPTEAANIQESLILKNFEEIRKTNKKRYIYYTPDSEPEVLEDLLPGEDFYLQQGEDIGEKMCRALEEVLKKEDKAVLIGSDLMDMNNHILDEALRALDKYDVVLSPAKDGGYGLIGMKTIHKDIFRLKEYSTDRVLEQTLDNIKALDLSFYLTEEIRDIDTKEDLLEYFLGTDEISLLGQGEYNINYLYRKNNKERVFRINTGSQMDLGDGQIPYEYRALKLLEPSGVTPKAYDLLEPETMMPFYSLTMEYVEGRPLDYDKDMKTAAKLLAKVHGLEPEEHHLIESKKPFREMYDECRQMASVYFRSELKDPVTEEYLLKFFRYEEELGLDDPVGRRCIINTELNNTNFIIGDHPVIIDWEKPLYGDKEQDLAHFLVPTTTFFRTDKILSEEEIESFLEEYEKYLLFDRARFDKYFVFTCLRGLTWCAMAYVEYSKERRIKNNETFEKIKQYLDPDFLKSVEQYYLNALQRRS